ncbi:putative acetyltransferase [Georgenia wutianyii]|uniref:putative acetyltransferase n=1 Tax=Georgenia wutianyii TaxID=2585135 RepID=UPI001E2C3DC2|nr:hypothetical protein [Georgenia wutianyii]
MRPLWADWPPGTRVVIRYRRPEGGFADALGDLVRADDERAVVATRRGEVEVPAAAVVVGKPVPPPPPRRAPKGAEGQASLGGESALGGEPHTTRSHGM